MLALPDAAARLPHRKLEFELLTRPAERRVNERMLRDIPPGWVIAINPYDLGALLPVVRRFQPFEPLDLERDFDELQNLWYENIDMSAEDIAAQQLSAAQQQPLDPAYWKASDVLKYAPWGLLIFLLCLGFGVTHALRSGRYHVLNIFLLPFIFSLVFTFARFLLLDHRYWLVPRGIVRGECWQWASRRRITRVGPESTPFVFDIDAYTSLSTAHFLARGKRYKVQILGFAVFGVTAGWLSTASPPSDEQVEGFVNPG